MIVNRRILLLYGSLFLFWILVFFVQRLIFLGYHNARFNSVEVTDVFKALYSGLRLDFSTAGYLMILPVLVLLIRFFASDTIFLKTLKAVFFVELILLSIIHAAEISAYSEWGHKLSSRVFMHLLNPDEVMRTTGFSKGALSFFIILMESLGSIFFVNRLFRWVAVPNETLTTRSKIWTLVLNGFGVISGLAFSFLLMRGGIQQIPINIDAAYFSNQAILNDLSVNSAYYFGNSFFLFNKSDIESHVKQSLSPEENALANAYYRWHPSDIRLFNVNKPNVIFIIFEGWSAHGVGAISGKKSATPFFDKLSKSGVLFTKLYAANTTSEIGNSAILSGFTGVPESPLPLYTEKHRNVSTLSDLLKSKGYSTSYLFSGDLKYGNIKGFLTEHSYDRLQDENDFDPSLPKGKLNYYDSDLYDKFLKEIRLNEPPFLACTFTGSTHFPYDCPMKKFPFHGEEADYLNSMVYADDCLKRFFIKAKTQDWYKNTVFVLVSDHGHNSPGIASPYLTETFKIPCLIVGPALKEMHQGLVVDRVFSQGDLAATLANQLDLRPETFPFSRNMLSDKTVEGAFISTIRGFGFVNSKGGYIYNLDAKELVFDSYENKKELNKNRRLSNACLFRLFSYFNSMDK
jgi:phosphoglycerol transferase MdoB-like AlkP superfamily enzyme